MQVTNLAYFYETSKKVRGGKWVWVKDSNGEQRGNVLLGGTIKNPKKGFDHLYAGQLVEYRPSEGCWIFRSFEATRLAGMAKDTIVIPLFDSVGSNNSIPSDIPEVGMVLMDAETEAFNAGDLSGTGYKVVSVEFSDSVTYRPTYNTYSDTPNVIKNDSGDYDGVIGSGVIVKLDKEFEMTSRYHLLVEGDQEDYELSQTGHTSALVTNPNCFVEADVDLMPMEGFGIQNANYSIAPVYNKQAWIARMQPLPEYVRKNNRSLIAGIFWV